MSKFRIRNFVIRMGEGVGGYKEVGSKFKISELHDDV